MVQSSVENTKPSKEPWLAASLSWLVPGIGQLYASSYVRAVMFIVLAGLFHIFWLASLMSAKWSVFAALAVWLCSLIILPVLMCLDAFKLAKRSNTCEFEAARTKGKDPWLVVFLSLLLPGLGHGYVRKWALLGLYLFSFFVLGILSKHAVYAFIALPLFRVFVCIHACAISPILWKQQKSTLIMFAILLISVQCLKGILMPWITTTYLVNGSNPTRGASMEPTLREKDKIITSKLAYVWDEPKVGDIIALKVPNSIQFPKSGLKRTEIGLVKRVVAIGGETVEVKNGKVYIDGKRRKFNIQEDFDESVNEDSQMAHGRKMHSSYLKFGVAKPYSVPEGCYFLLGDNIQYSIDSRYFGAVSKDEIIGKVVKIYWPSRRIGILY